jgi:type I restriction enzyme, R subunit
MRPTWKVESSEYMRLRLYFEEFGQIYVPLLENDTLVQQAMSNSKEQFANSPDLKDTLMHAITDAFDAHTTMSTQALGSERVRDGLKDILLGPAQLYEALRARSDGPPTAAPQ